MIDPLELGASFSDIPKLAEGPNSARIIDTKIWSKEKDIEIKINDVTYIVSEVNRNDVKGIMNMYNSGTVKMYNCLYSFFYYIILYIMQDWRWKND